MNCKCKKCCLNNFNKEMFETACENCPNVTRNNCPCNNCECGFDEEINLVPENPMFGQSYVPIQYMDKTFTPCVGLKMGTLFPELVSPYMPCQSIDEINFIRETNKIGEGCNKC